MRLVLYSGGDSDDNEELDYELIDLIGKKRPSITFIPPCIDEADHYFDEFIDYFSKYGFDDFTLFPVDIHHTRYQVYKALSKDLVYLSGGNTFYFLKHLKRSGVAHMLKEYVDEGGVLAGHSAGAIMMTPNISTASYPNFDCDDNDVNLKNWRSMGFTHFEFFPHYQNTRRYIHELGIASQNLSMPIFAVPDGSGIVVNDEKLSFVGDIWGFFRGKKFSL